MTREEMLADIEQQRQQGHNIGIPGQVGKWVCEFDGVRVEGTTPMEAYEKAKALALGGR